MATTWGFYEDAGLTVPQTLGATVVDGAGPTDRIIYFGSPSAGKTLQAKSDPGTDQITVGPADADAGTGAPATAIKLALSAGGLDSATAGAAINVGATLSSGAANRVTLYVRTTQGALAVGSYADLSLTTNSVAES